LSSPELFDVATDLICETLAWSSKQRHSDPATVAALVSRVMPLSSWIAEAVRDEDTDRVRCLARMFSEAGEAYLDLIVRDFASFKGTDGQYVNLF
jgi:transportin-3